MKKNEIVPPQIWVNNYAEQMRPYLSAMLENFEYDFKESGDTIYIWQAVQWCTSLEVLQPQWIVKYFVAQTLNGEGIKFDGRSINRQKEKLRNVAIYQEVEHRVKSKELDLSKAYGDVGNNIGLTDSRVKDIHEKVRARLNKANKFAKEALERHRKR